MLRAPLHLFALQVALWFAAAVLFGILDGSYSGSLGLRVAVIVAITGLVTAACAYLFTERFLRSSAARALVSGTPERLAVPGVATRAVLAWGIGTGLPVVGVVVIGILALSGEQVSQSQLGIAMVVLGSIGITVGLLALPRTISWGSRLWRWRNTEMMMARPMTASAAATAMTKNTTTCPCIEPRKRENAMNVRLTAFSISSTDIKTTIKFRRTTTPATPIAKITALRIK